MLTVVCKKTSMLWIFPTTSKRAPARTIRFILTAPNNEKHPCTCIVVYDHIALENSTYLTNLLIEQFKIFMENTGGDASWPLEK